MIRSNCGRSEFAVNLSKSELAGRHKNSAVTIFHLCFTLVYVIFEAENHKTGINA